MAKEIEIEYKNLLTENEYHDLIQSNGLSMDNRHEQTNIYFDTADNTLKKNKQGLRVRLLKNKIEFTLKVPQENNYTYLEITDILETYLPEVALKKQITTETSDVLAYLQKENIRVSDLVEIGSLTTKRIEKKLNSSTLLVLDKSHYYGVTDYELEMEVANSSTGHETFIEFLNTHQIPIRPAKKKIARMFERKSSLDE